MPSDRCQARAKSVVRPSRPRPPEDRPQHSPPSPGAAQATPQLPSLPCAGPAVQLALDGSCVLSTPPPTSVPFSSRPFPSACQALGPQTRLQLSASVL